MMRKCEACGKPIPQRQFVQLTICILWSDRNEQQDAVEQRYGDYCDGCVARGAAVEDLVSGLTKYKGLEAKHTRRRTL